MPSAFLIIKAILNGILGFGIELLPIISNFYGNKLLE